MSTENLSTYLLERGVDLPKPSRDIFDDGERLKNATQAWITCEKGIRAVVEQRVHKIREELLLHARPEEVIVLRQVLVEVASILDDFQTCVAESERRRKAQEGNTEDLPEQTEVEAPDTDDTKSSM